jgi:chlorite dismutase
VFAGEPAPGAHATALPRHRHGRLPQRYLLADEQRRRMFSEYGMAAPRLPKIANILSAKQDFSSQT